MTLDHIAVAVRALEPAADRLCALLGYTRATTPVVNTRQQVRVLFLEKAGSAGIKLIEPSGPESPLVEFVRKGGGLHHVAFRVADVRDGCDALTAGGARVIAGPEPGEAFDDALIAFCYLGFGMNAELIDTDRRRNRIGATSPDGASSS